MSRFSRPEPELCVYCGEELDPFGICDCEGARESAPDDSCSQGCDAAASFAHPEWPQDEDQRLCADCMSGALEEKIDELENDLEDYRRQLKDINEKGVSA